MNNTDTTNYLIGFLRTSAKWDIHSRGKQNKKNRLKKKSFARKRRDDRHCCAKRPR